MRIIGSIGEAFYAAQLNCWARPDSGRRGDERIVFP